MSGVALAIHHRLIHLRTQAKNANMNTQPTGVYTLLMGYGTLPLRWRGGVPLVSISGREGYRTSRVTLAVRRRLSDISITGSIVCGRKAVEHPPL